MTSNWRLLLTHVPDCQRYIQPATVLWILYNYSFLALYNNEVMISSPSFSLSVCAYICLSVSECASVCACVILASCSVENSKIVGDFDHFSGSVFGPVRK